MNIYHLKMLLFAFLFSQFVNCRNNMGNINLINKYTQRTSTASRMLAEIHKPNNPHYHNDPELKKTIDKLNEEAIKKYQQSHDPYQQLQELVEKNVTKTTGKNNEQEMSKIEKELLETYEEMFGNENHIMLKSGMYTNDNDKSNEKSSTCECNDINNTDLTKTKGKDKYLKHLNQRCTRGIYFCSVGSALLTMLGLAFGKAAAVKYIFDGAETCVSSVSIFSLFDKSLMTSALESITGCTTGVADMAGSAVGYSTAIFHPCGIAALVLLIITVALIILYIWLYRRRKNSLKHECKKHLCK
ncbi:hypothetical protein C923_00828 [Plasmodium falciparum UGT5.1]|uniref:Surface antigen n=1 Tax=Plasmodium falciparum UGT5.1 TaxID=1237627 RepID=W7JTV6_PLAFA|nr:hypothetical protein C923_00828 [Plasmodium falciparum UGT5.1]